MTDLLPTNENLHSIETNVIRERIKQISCVDFCFLESVVINCRSIQCFPFEVQVSGFKQRTTICLFNFILVLISQKNWKLTRRKRYNGANVPPISFEACLSLSREREREREKKKIIPCQSFHFTFVTRPWQEQMCDYLWSESILVSSSSPAIMLLWEAASSPRYKRLQLSETVNHWMIAQLGGLSVSWRRSILISLSARQTFALFGYFRKHVPQCIASSLPASWTAERAIKWNICYFKLLKPICSLFDDWCL